MYLSGQPLHVITLTLADEFRRALGPDFPVSFSAGIDRANFPLVVACGFVPVTASNDLLRPGGYGRMGGCLERLAAEMRHVAQPPSTSTSGAGPPRRARRATLHALRPAAWWRWARRTQRPSLPRRGRGKGGRPAHRTRTSLWKRERFGWRRLANLALVAELTRRDPALRGGAQSQDAQSRTLDAGDL